MQDFENRQVRSLLAHCLKREGSTLSVLDEEGDVLTPATRDHDALLRNVHACDLTFIVWRDANGERVGKFMLVFGNGPGELLSDFTANEACEAAWAHVQRVAGE